MPLAALADAPSAVVLISEVQTGTPASASQEFVELYNPGAADISVAGWTIDYKSATGTDSTWTKRATLSGSIKAHGFYLIAPKAYLPAADAEWSATMASTGGNIRFKNAAGVVQDQLGYGASANSSESAPASAPSAGQSMERLPGRLAEDGGNATDTGNNANDFIVRTTPLPQSTQSAIETPQEATSAEPSPEPAGMGAGETATAQNYLPVTISELFIDPAAPLTDAADEYIELHNPNQVSVDLTDYVLKAGSGFHDFYLLPSVILAPDAYVAFYADQTHISLTNSGGAAQILDPLGNIVSQTGTYTAAPTGQTWAKFGNGWQWTLQTTPGAENILLAPALAAAKTSSAPKAASHKAASKTATAAKSKPKVALAKHKTTKPKAASTTSPKLPVPTIHASAWLLGVLAVLTIGYASYEFRNDIRNLYLRARGNKAARLNPRKTP